MGFGYRVVRFEFVYMCFVMRVWRFYFYLLVKLLSFLMVGGDFFFMMFRVCGCELECIDW